MAQHELVSLPDEIIMEILTMASDSIGSVMKFGMTCTSLYEIITQRGTLLWTNVLERMKRKDGTRFKKNVLSILDIDQRHMPDKCQRLMKIVRHQYRFQVKKRIVSKMRNERIVQEKKKFIENVKVEDEIIKRIINPFKGSIYHFYSPENFICARYGGSFERFLYFLMSDKLAHFTMKETVDHLFKKTNAHQKLTLKNRFGGKSSEFYSWVMLAYNREYYVNQLISLLEFVTNVQDAVLLITFIYFECPIYHEKVNYQFIKSWTGLTVDQEKDGNFLKHLKNILKENQSILNQNSNIISQALTEVKLQLYGPKFKH